MAVCGIPLRATAWPGHGLRKARFDVRDRNFGGESGKGAAERARRVALDDEQVGRLAKGGRTAVVTFLTYTCGSSDRAVEPRRL